MYALYLQLKRGRNLQIGRLGIILFQPGIYVYIGSARGPGGVIGRVNRHLSPANGKTCHWHIDWLRQVAQPLGIHWTQATKSQECLWAEKLECLAVREPSGFGASDCKCRGHLLRFLSVKDPYMAINQSYGLIRATCDALHWYPNLPNDPTTEMDLNQ